MIQLHVKRRAKTIINGTVLIESCLYNWKKASIEKRDASHEAGIYYMTSIAWNWKFWEFKSFFNYV